MTGATLDPVAARRLIEARLGRPPAGHARGRRGAGGVGRPARAAARSTPRARSCARARGAPAPSTGALPERDEEQGRARRGADLPAVRDRHRRLGRPARRERRRRHGPARGHARAAGDARAPVGAQQPLPRPRARARRARRAAAACSCSPRAALAGARLARRGHRGADRGAADRHLGGRHGARPLPHARRSTRPASCSPPPRCSSEPAPVAVLAAGAGAVLLAILVAAAPAGRRRRAARRHALDPRRRRAAAIGVGDRPAADHRPDGELDRRRGAGARAAAVRLRRLLGRLPAARPRRRDPAQPPAGVAVGAPAPRGFASPPLRLFLAALAELLAVAAVLSALVLLLARGAARRATPSACSPASACSGRPRCSPACSSRSAARRSCSPRSRSPPAPRRCCAGATSRRSPAPASSPAALVVTALLLPVALTVLGRPASTLATALWIT